MVIKEGMPTSADDRAEEVSVGTAQGSDHRNRQDPSGFLIHLRFQNSGSDEGAVPVETRDAGSDRGMRSKDLLLR